VVEVSGGRELKKRPAKPNRYAAKLLFQFRVIVDGRLKKRRLCEERIILIDAPTAKKALQQAKRRGKQSEFDYANSDCDPVKFEFIGVMDLMELGIECAEGEVWYDIVERISPSERRDRLIPPESQLSAIRNESPTLRIPEAQLPSDLV